MDALTFAAPWQWLWLALLPLLWWWSLPPRPRQPHWTPHLAQYQAALVALRRRPPRVGWLRFLLLAVAVAGAVFTLAAPRWRGAAGARRLVVVVDASASAKARDAAGRAAFDELMQALDRGFAHVPPQVEVTLLRAGGPLLRRHGASARWRQDLGAPAGERSADLVELASTVAALPETAVWTLTDGQGQVALPEVGALTVAPRAASNAAVLRVEVEDRWPLPGLSLAVTLIAFPRPAGDGAGASPVAVNVRLAGAAVTPQLQALELPLGQPTTATFELTRLAAGGELEVAIELPGDALPDDDRWRAWLPPLPAPRISVLAAEPASPFAAAAAAALAGEVGGEVVPAVAGEAVGFLLVDGGETVLQPGAVRAITFATRCRDGLTATAPPPAPAPPPRQLAWARELPLGAGLDLSELVVQQAAPSLLPSGEVFLWAEDGADRVPLGVVVDGDERASVHFGFRLADSNLPLLAAFPQLLRRAFLRCHGGGANLRVLDPAPAAGEQDLRQPATAPDRPLPTFAVPDLDLSPVGLLLVALALACRSWVR